MIIDTHMHIFDEKYQNPDDVVEEALKNDVKKMIAVGYDKKTSLQAIELANKYEFIYASVGLHPSEVLKEIDENLEWLEKCLNEPKVIAIGEIGLDYYWDKSFKEQQKMFFKKQIEIAKRNNLPIIVHCRDAIQDCFDILKDEKVSGVLHCYSGSYEMAKEFVKRGFYLGIGGVVTFKNANEIKKVVKDIDLSFLLSETDSPYLTPVPFRGKINQPAYTKYVVMEIANIKGVSCEYVCSKIENNVKKLFKI